MSERPALHGHMGAGEHSRHSGTGIRTGADNHSVNPAPQRKENTMRDIYLVPGLALGITVVWCRLTLAGAPREAIIRLREDLDGSGEPVVLDVARRGVEIEGNRGMSLDKWDLLHDTDGWPRPIESAAVYLRLSRRKPMTHPERREPAGQGKARRADQ